MAANLTIYLWLSCYYRPACKISSSRLFQEFWTSINLYLSLLVLQFEIQLSPSVDQKQCPIYSILKTYISSNAIIHFSGFLVSSQFQGDRCLGTTMQLLLALWSLHQSNYIHYKKCSSSWGSVTVWVHFFIWYMLKQPSAAEVHFLWATGRKILADHHAPTTNRS